MPRNDHEQTVSFIFPDIGPAEYHFAAGWTGSRWEQYWYIPHEDIWAGDSPIFVAAQEAILDAFGLPLTYGDGLDSLMTTSPQVLASDGRAVVDEPYHTLKHVMSFVEWSRYDNSPYGFSRWRAERMPNEEWVTGKLEDGPRWSTQPTRLSDFDLWRLLNASDVYSVFGRPRAFRWKSIFLAHSSTDKPFVRTLASRLSQLGIRVWLDEAEIKIGDSLFACIESAIDRVDCMGVVLSSVSVKSRWVQEELRMAMSRQLSDGIVVVLPLLLEDVVIPGFLREKKYADFRDSDAFDAGLDALASTLRQTFIDSEEI